MNEGIYESRAEMLDKRLTYLVGLLDNYDPVNQADEYNKVCRAILILEKADRENASVLAEKGEREVETDRYFKGISRDVLAKCGIMCLCLAAGMLFEKLDIGGILQSKWLSPTLSIGK